MANRNTKRKANEAKKQRAVDRWAKLLLREGEKHRHTVRRSK